MSTSAHRDEQQQLEELERLHTLRDYEILDTPPEAVFDELTSLAAYICKTPTALITLIDEKRQWFKSRHGFSARETPREIAFCAHVIAGGEMTVRDALEDTRFAANELVTGDPRIRAYAGVPLLVADGKVLGTLAVIDYVPRTFDEQQLAGLRTLAHQVVAQLELRRHAMEASRLHREGLARFELVARATNDAVWDWDLVTNEIWWNDGMNRLFGYTPEDLPNIDAWGQLLHPDDAKLVEQSLYAVIHSGRKYWSAEYRFRRHDGTYADVFDRGYVIHEGDKPIRMIGAMLDITERRRLEQQLRQAQKMDAIGQLSGGIAHDFNNLLTAIQVNAALIVRRGKDPDVKTQAADIIEATARAAALTRQLLMVSRKQVMRQTAVDINDVVRNMMRMLQRIVGEDIALDVDCSQRIPRVLADAGMLEQVLLNLVVNARDAMPGGGELHIATGFAPRPPAVATTTEQGFETAPGPHVTITVRDNGRGIAPENLPHIFEPFFTTKDVGKGTGLGLATVYGIVRQHRGHIDVSSVPGGTTFTIYLPVTDQPATSEVPLVLPDRELPTGNETILVVEDEEGLRRILVSLLESCGYRVIEASSGAAALELWTERQHAIELVLTDLVMPGGITGRELARWLHLDAPNLPVVYTSGYSTELVGAGEPLVEGKNYIQKPYQPEKLAMTIRNCLDRARDKG